MDAATKSNPAAAIRIVFSPVTGTEHRARIELPVAEMGSATTRATGVIALPGVENSYAQFAHIHLSNKGVVD
jgi:hypothetical protein